MNDGLLKHFLVFCLQGRRHACWMVYFLEYADLSRPAGAQSQHPRS